ncbi:hypothetical protein Tco_0399101, partial [Tanacetum coccineum]
MYFPCVEINEVTKLLGIYRDDEGEFSRIGVVKGRNQHRRVDKRSYDLIDYECIDDMDFWVVKEEPQEELDYDQLETMLDDQDEEP